jgi:hypothetical protein
MQVLRMVQGILTFSRQSLNFNYPSGIAKHDRRCMHFVNLSNKRGQVILSKNLTRVLAFAF